RTTSPPALPIYGTLFDIPTKLKERDKLLNMQGEPNFWTNQEKAQKTIQAQKSLNALLKPYEEVTSAINDVNALVELSEEDASLEAELSGEVERAAKL